MVQECNPTSSKMFRASGHAMYPADLWSLGVTMFELLTCTLPFQPEPGSNRNWEDVISGDMVKKTPKVLDRIVTDRDMRSELGCSLASMIAKALEKKMTARFLSSDEMNGVIMIFGCLVLPVRPVAPGEVSRRKFGEKHRIFLRKIGEKSGKKSSFIMAPIEMDMGPPDTKYPAKEGEQDVRHSHGNIAHNIAYDNHI
jgi:serine/threonine protein kinase